MNTHEWSRRTFLQGSLAAGTMAVAGRALADSSDDLLARARSSGTMTLGVSVDPPWSYATADGEFTGISYEIAKAVLKELGIGHVTAVVVDFDSLIPGLKAKRFDTVGDSMYITPKRCEQVLFTNPFHVAGEAFAVATGNPKGVSDFPSIAKSGAKLGLVAGSAEFQYAKDAGIDESGIVVFTDLPSAVAGVRTGRIDATAYDYVGLGYEVHTSKASVDITEPFTPTIAGNPQYGASAFIFRQEDAAMRDAFNAAQAKLVASGQIPDIANKFVSGLTGEIMQAQKLDARTLCTAQ
jgi:polar amino acid transport system substrate-binding protein